MADFEAWLVFLILVVNAVGELQRKRTLAVSRGFLAAARLSCLILLMCEREINLPALFCSVTSQDVWSSCQPLQRFIVSDKLSMLLAISVGTRARRPEYISRRLSALN